MKRGKSFKMSAVSSECTFASGSPPIPQRSVIG
jgi:hypothetical protein